MNNLTLEIGSVKINIKSDNINFEHLSKEGYHNFLSNGSSFDISLKVRPWKSKPDFKRRHLIFEAADSWKLYKENGSRYLFDIFSPASPAWLDKIGVADEAFSRAEIYLAPPPPDFYMPIADGELSNNEQSTRRLSQKNTFLDYISLSKIVRPFTEILLANYLKYNGGIMAHGLGIITQGRGILFTGVSGAGKSTLAKLFAKYSPQATILNDERVIIKKQGSKFFIYGSPWCGDAGIYSNKSAPLKNIFFIYHKDRNRTDDLSQGYALEQMLAQSYLSFWDKGCLYSALNLYNSLLLSGIKYKNLGFVNDERIIEFLKEENIL